MMDFMGIYRLNELLKQLPKEDNSETGDGGETAKEASLLIEGLVRGDSHKAEWKQRYSRFHGFWKVRGAFAKEDEDSDETLLREILSVCSEEAREQLIVQYGKDSKIGLLIVEMQEEKEKETEKKREKNGRNKQTAAADDLKKKLNEKQNSFYQLLGERIDARGYKSDSEFYNSINFPRQLFSKLRRPDYTLHKDNVFWLLAGLRVDYWEAVQLLGAAGYSFRKNIRRDVIIAYVMKNGDYTLDSLNEMLFFFGEKPLGSIE